jgi:hypothetical protein
MNQRFWVIGGEYTGMDFKALRQKELEGPFDSPEAAHAAWKRLSGQHSSRATTRFSIAAEPVARAN